MISSEFEVIILVPVLQRQIGQGRRVRKLQIREMPIQYLAIL